VSLLSGLQYSELTSRSGALSYISKTFWSSVRARPSGTYVYRGYAAARLASGKEKEKEPRSGNTSRRGSAASMRRPDMEAAPVVEAARDKSFLNSSAIDEENIPVESVSSDPRECPLTCRWTTKRKKHRVRISS
jgi:hypothetical protein